MRSLKLDLTPHLEMAQSLECILKARLHDTTVNRFDNGLHRVNKHPTGCQIGCATGLTTGWMFVYTMQPVVQAAVQLNSRLYNRLYVCKHDTTCYPTGCQGCIV